MDSTKFDVPLDSRRSGSPRIEAPLLLDILEYASNLAQEYELYHNACKTHKQSEQYTGRKPDIFVIKLKTLHEKIRELYKITTFRKAEIARRSSLYHQRPTSVSMHRVQPMILVETIQLEEKPPPIDMKKKRWYLLLFGCIEPQTKIDH
jgi:hypothetical protein